MILAVDVHYRDNLAMAAGIVFNNWGDDHPLFEKRIELTCNNEYIPGKFYLRELPCILELLKCFIIFPDVIIIDGNVYLGKESAPGLGTYLYKSLNEQVPVIGVAKSAYKNTPENTFIYRGKSSRPLYITSIGIDIDAAKFNISNMYGTSRIPYMLKRVDQLARK